MPSRTKKGRKALRDNKATNDFFNQVDANVGPDVCPCCNNRIQRHAKKYKKPGSSSDNNHAKPILGKESLKCSVTVTDYQIDNKKTAAPVRSLIQEKLLSEGRVDPQSLLDAQNEIPNLEGAKQALILAYKRMKNTPVLVYLFSPLDTFDMGNLEEVEETYDTLWKMSEDDNECLLAKAAERIRNFTVTASDVKQSSEDRLRAKLDIHKFDIHGTITAPLSSCLRQMQLFNMNKKFGFLEEALRALHHGDKKRHGGDVCEELQLSFRQKLNNPFKLMESASEESKKKSSLDDGPVNFQSLDDALDTFRGNLQTTTEEFFTLRKTVSDAERPTKPPSPPSSFKYKGVPVPEGIPDHIHQCLFDAAFLMKEVVVLQKEASEQYHNAQRTLAAWYHASQEIWYVQGCMEGFSIGEARFTL